MGTYFTSEWDNKNKTENKHFEIATSIGEPNNPILF